MKIVKIVLKVLAWLVALVVVAVLTLPLWFGSVVTTVANAIVPGIVKTDFRIGHLSLNPYTARFELGGLQLANPAGYPEKYAATVGDIVFDAKTFSLATDVIHIEEIKIKDIFVSYVSGGPAKINNFTQLQQNIAGSRKASEARQTKEGESAVRPEAGGRAETPARQEPKDSSRPEKRFIIDRLEISGLMVQFGFLPIRQPLPLVMTDIGLKTGGATASEVFQQVWAEILRQAGVVSDQLKALGGAAGHATKSVKALGESTKELGSAVQSLGEGLKAGKGTKAVDDGVKKASESAKKAMDSLKGLW